MPAVACRWPRPLRHRARRRLLRSRRVAAGAHAVGRAAAGCHRRRRRSAGRLPERHQERAALGRADRRLRESRLRHRLRRQGPHRHQRPCGRRSQKTFKVTRRQQRARARPPRSSAAYPAAGPRRHQARRGAERAAAGDVRRLRRQVAGRPDRARHGHRRSACPGSVTQGIVSAVGRTVSESRRAAGTGATIAEHGADLGGDQPGQQRRRAGQSRRRGRSASRRSPPSTRQLGDSAAPGIGFAIPASMVTTIADQIIKDGKVTDSGRAALGITGRTVVDDDYQPAGVARGRASRRAARPTRRASRPGTSSPRSGDARHHDDHLAVRGAGRATSRARRSR